MPRMNFTIPKRLKKKLVNASEDTGLSQAEIIRRGTLDQVKELNR